jgi:hypothetical protein
MNYEREGYRMRKRYINNENDLTFIFTQQGTGYNLKIMDNSSDEEINRHDLNEDAKRFYIKCLIELTKNKLKQLQTA